MKVSLNFAKQYSSVDISQNGVDEVIRRIGAQLGAIEDVEYWGKKYEKATIVQVVTCQKHPNADKLSVCLVDDGGVTPNVERDTNGHVQVVCGAPNVAAGVFAVWLPPAATVPATHGTSEPFVLGSRELRGVVSNGMMAAPDELGLEGGHDGLLLLQNVKPGDSFADVYGLNDVVFDLENKMFTHRPDCFGVLGVARELAGIQGLAFQSPEWYLGEPVFTKPSTEKLPVKVQVNTELVPRFMAVVMNGVKVNSSPRHIQSALILSGIRPINNVVDITNYLMQLTGQPLHAYDYDKLLAHSKQQIPSLIARPAAKGEKVTLLNGKELELKDDQAVVIASDNIAVGIGGVMGGADTEVDDSTRNIIIECATFDMYNIRKTAMKYGLFTDAVTRFNKGQSPLQNDRVLAEAMRMITELAGGEQASEVKDVKSELVVSMPSVSTEASFINLRLGSNLTSEQIAALLKNVEFDVKIKGDVIEVAIPFWRRDIECAEDIVEEVGRLYGFGKLPVSLPDRKARAAEKDHLLSFKARLRAILAAAGSNEILTYNFVHADLLQKVGQDATGAFVLANALSPNLQHYRLSLTPSILEKITPNIRAGYDDFTLFEIGKAHAKKWIDEDGLPIEAERLALVTAASKKAAKRYEGAPYYQARVYATELFQKLGIDVKYVAFKDASAAIVASEPLKPFLPTRSAVITSISGEFIGVVGEYTDSTVKSLKLPDFCAGFELDIKQLMLATASAGVRYKELPKFPKVEQDISLRVSKDVAYADLIATLLDALEANKPARSYAILSPLDIYEDDTKSDIKHVAFRLSIANYERTLTAEGVNALLDVMAANAASAHNATRI